MNRKQLHSLISAGVFSAALLAGTAYAEEAKMESSGKPAPTEKSMKKHKMKHRKEMTAKMHGCAGQNDCKGKGGCKGSDGGCKGKNSCKGKGGCATDGSMKK